MCVCACVCVVLVARACECVRVRVCVCALADDEGKDDSGRHHLVLAAAFGCTPPLMPTRVQHHRIWPPLLAAASLARDVARIRVAMAMLAPRRAARAHRAAATHAPLVRVQRRDFASLESTREAALRR